MRKLEQDAVKVDPKHYKVELENDRVRVVRISYAGREKSVMHQNPPGVGIFLTDARFKFTYPDGKVEDISAKRGEFLWFATFGSTCRKIRLIRVRRLSTSN